LFNVTSSIMYKDYVEMRKRIGQPDQRNYCHSKSMESLVGTKTIVFCNGYRGPTPFRNPKERFLELTEHDTLIWSTVKLSIERVAPTTHPGTCWAAMWGFEPWEPSPVPRAWGYSMNIHSDLVSFYLFKDV
jgi:hypothetical protein